MDSLLRVLIADDEPIIREGVRDSVDWPSLGMSVCAEAEDGEEALELALQHRIHIALVDLNMPIMNGITLMKELRQKLPQCRIIIITGHDEFSYAQEAIRLGVDDYILKPANAEQLRQVLTRIRHDLETAQRQEEHLQRASKQIVKNFPLMRERFCLEWIEGTMTEEELVEQLEFLRLPTHAPTLLGVIRWPELNASVPLRKENDRQLFLFAIENIVSEILVEYEITLFREHAGLIVLIVWGTVPEALISDMQHAVQAYLKISIQVHMQPVEEGLLSVPAVYRQCKSSIYKETQMSPLVRRAKDYIRETYMEADMSLEAFANLMNVSPVYLSRIIKQELGTSFVGLVTQMRISKAIQLLNATDLPINEIAEKVGYDTQHYFSTAFKKAVGVSPIQYRKGAAFQEEDG
ncbi:response regulator transcription factor [Paenibacillus prosopidis]|uniref:Two-component system response regulator YesN n=1 Tax=Paenibacillus prosopidis TaxID=630520 RepID=A0A368VXP8_9BACL|nr:response regulator [Paenibacillus prosopidis]RCW44332.1 two-component system response regulator YesN [Paenibacillus prosopidis]